MTVSHTFKKDSVMRRAVATLFALGALIGQG